MSNKKPTFKQSQKLREYQRKWAAVKRLRIYLARDIRLIEQNIKEPVFMYDCVEQKVKEAV